MTSHLDELMAEESVVQLLGPERFDRLRAGGWVRPTRPGSQKYLASYVRLRLAEDRRLGGGSAVVVKSHRAGAGGEDGEPSLLTVEQAADRLGVGAGLIRHLAETGRLTSYALAGGEPGFRPDVLDREARRLYLRKDATQADIESAGGPPRAGPGRDPVRQEITDRYTEPGQDDPRQILAALYSHAKSEEEYLKSFGVDLGSYALAHIHDRKEHLRRLFKEQDPDGDLDSLVEKYEQDQDGGSMQPGEAGLVDQGRVPPEDEEEDWLRDLYNGRSSGKGRQVCPSVERKLVETIAVLQRAGYMPGGRQVGPRVEAKLREVVGAFRKIYGINV